MRHLLSFALVASLAVAASSVTAQRWGYPGGSPYGWGDFGPGPARDRSREGKVEATRFVADGPAAQALGHGPIAVTAAKDGVDDERERATYEAAVIDRLAGVGYDTASRGAAGQTMELRIVHTELEPAELPHKPVSGAMSVGVSSRGGSYESLAIGVDMSKPLKALLGTRLEARIRDQASGAVLWEGHADIATREGDRKWTDQAIAAKLAGALFSGFPGRNGETIRAG